MIAHSDGPGLGSEFIVRLPRIEAPAGTRNGVSAPASRGPRDGERVMVVDDNVDAAELIADGLRVQGFTVRVAHDPLNALELAREFAPAICVLDIGLPVMDGYTLGRELHARLRAAPPILIALTGYGQAQDKRRSEEGGFTAHLV